MGRSKRKRKGRGWWSDWVEPAFVRNGPYVEGCVIHDGDCAPDSTDLHHYEGPGGTVVIGLCDNHVAALDPEGSGFVFQPVTEPPVTSEVECDRTSPGGPVPV